jgi:hypothetical protein
VVVAAALGVAAAIPVATGASGLAPGSVGTPPTIPLTVTTVPVTIPSLPGAPAFLGRPATPHPIAGVPATPQNPFMAPNGRSEIHDDGWQTDFYTWRGPLGRAPVTLSSQLGRECGSIAFDRLGRILSICVGLSGPQLYMLDSHTLATLATFALPPRQSVPSNPFQDFTGGGYFYLDSHDRVVTATTTHHIWVIAETPGRPGFTLARDYDLTHVLSSSENLTSALPDSNGLLWFVTKTDGVVGTLNFATRAVHVMRLGHGTQGEIENSFAVGANGDVYIATNRKLYRFGADRRGRPRIVWQVAYPNSFEHKPGQVDDGTGTTPTVMPGGFVNITDNADPMDVVVYRTAAHPIRVVRRYGRLVRVRVSRTVCRVPVFRRGASDTENSLIAAGRSMIVENNYGYSGPETTVAGGQTTPGFARVDVNRSGTGCRLVWTTRSLDAPTVVPKLSLAAGLIYAYVKGPGLTDPWYWATLDFRTGQMVYEQLAGTGAGYNNNYSGIVLSRAGTAYLGVLGGIIALRDGG